MEQKTELRRVYSGAYTVYQRDGMYCLLPGRVQAPQLSVQESLELGGSYVFCTAPGQEDVPARLVSYLSKWKTPPFFLWLENPSAVPAVWKVQKLERYGPGQRLVLGSDCLELGRWQDIAVEGDSFEFRYGEGDGFCFCSGGLRLPGSGNLRVLAGGEDCGVLAGCLTAAEPVCFTLLEQLHAGIWYSCLDESGGVEAANRGFLKQAYSPVLEPKTAMQLPMRLAPHRLLDPARTSLSVAGYTFSSRLVTRTGHQLCLTAQQDGKLVLQRRAVLARYDKKGQLYTRTALYWGLSGSFSLDRQTEPLLCGLSGTESLALTADAYLQFYPSMPAVAPYQDQGLGTTSWIGSTGGGRYYCQPEESALYHAVEQQGLRMLEIPAAVFDRAMPPAPLLPCLGLELDGTRTVSQWEEGIFQARHSILTGNQADSGAEDGVCGVTPQGLTARVTRDGQYQWLGVASLSGTQAGSPPELSFFHIDQQTRARFQCKNLLYVVDSPEKMAALQPSEGFCFSVDGIRFDLRPKAWRTDSQQPTLFVMQYSPACSMRQALQDHPVFKLICQSAYTENGDLRSGYEAFAAAVDDPGFEGILAMNVAVALDSLPLEVEFLMNGVDREQFCASYLVLGAGQIQADAEGQPVLMAATADGLIDYAAEDHLSYSKEPPDYDYLTTEIRIRIQENRLISFYSTSELLVRRLFEAQAQAVENPDGNCLILQGQMVEKDQERIYQYALKQQVNYTLRGSGIQSVQINRLDLVAGAEGSGQFQLSGVAVCREMEGADLLGFGGGTPQQGLPFSQLVLRMEPGGQGKAARFSMEYGQLLFHQENAAVRAGSFPDQFAVRLESFVLEQGGQTPGQKGYIAINAPVRQDVPGDTYQGFVWTLDVGSLGGLSDQSLVQLRLMTAFWPDEAGQPAYYLGMQLPGAGGGDQWKLQGLFRLGFDALSLEQTRNGFQLRLHNFQVQMLGVSFPEGSSDIVLFSDGKQIGWYAAYEEE